MEKMIYFLNRSASVAVEEFNSTLLDTTVGELRKHGAFSITINLADLNDVIERAAPGRLVGAWREVSAAVSFWHATIDERAPIEACLRDCGASITGYLVTESVVQPFAADWEGGQRRPGITQFGANGKPDGVSDEEFYHTWQVVHSAQSFALHPLRWSYIRNAVARPLTPGAPTYRAIVSEHFRTLEDFTDDSRYFGSQQALEEMIGHMPGFCDLGNMFSLAMSEYHFQ